MNRRGMAGGSALLMGLGITWASALTSGCYTTGDGTAPPPDKFYYPVGMAVSQAGNVMYVANSDFDLQWNGGTVQSYDLHAVRLAAADQVANPPAGCPGTLPDYEPGTTIRQPLGNTCSPPVDSTPFFRDSVTIGAFATDIQLARFTKNRLFVPVRGDASVTWFDVVPDAADAPPDPKKDTRYTYAPFALDCGALVGNRCDEAHHAGQLTDTENTRQLTLPGEPFGMAQSEDGAYFVLTHQNETKTSLFSTGAPALLSPGATDPAQRCNAPAPLSTARLTDPPSIQFVLDGMPVGGNGIVAVPHDPCAYFAPSGATTASAPPRPAFLQTTRAAAELDLVRFYPDHGPADPVPTGSTLFRPYIVREAAFPLIANASGVDSRGIVIDDTPRRACKIKVSEDATLTGDARNEALAACARRSARVFFANRSPATMLIGEVGDAAIAPDGTYNADSLQIYANVPLTAGPSRLYLAPIIDKNGNYALRVFIVCFDSQTVFIWDPDAGQVENIIHVGRGPFALAFDPFDMDDVAARRPAAKSTDGQIAHKYRFAYVASFTDSFVQVVDLDDTIQDTSGARYAYERVVYTLGYSQPPKGSH